MLPARRAFPARFVRFASLPTAHCCGLVACAVLFASAGQLAAAADDKKQPPEPVRITLRTADGVSLAGKYYPSPAADESGKDVAVVMLVHAYKGRGSDFDELAVELQNAGHAAIAPDLRGHGDSGGPDGELGVADFAAMARLDLEAVKGFLVDKNNAGELNIERLGVVGVELGSSLALNWAALDWSWPVLATGKQGQDVKALALVSPQWSYKGLRIDDAVTHPSIRKELSVLIVAGRRNSRMAQGARRLHNALARYHATPPRGKAAEHQTLWLKTPPTSLQGMQLMDEQSFQVTDMILNFVELRLVNPAYPWRPRRSPLN